MQWQAISNWFDPAPEAGKQLVWRMFWVGLIVRIAYMTLAHTYRYDGYEDHFHFGWEMGRIGRALATGQGYANPFTGHTGPTAWTPPLYPLLIGGIFKLLGIYSSASAWALLAIDSVFSALTALAVYEIAERCYDRNVAKWAGWLWALYPAAMQYAVRWIWEICLTTVLFAAVLVLALRMRRIGEATFGEDSNATLGQWLLFGLLWGLVGLSNSTLLLFLPACGIWILLGERRKIPALRNAVLSGFIFLACIVPWIWRNWEVFHAFVPMRSNLGVEMWAWNNPDATGIALGAPIEPNPKDPRYIAYATMGELAYSKHQGNLAKAYIRKEPLHFALLSVKRFYFYWVSVPHPVNNQPLIEGARELNYCLLSLTGIMGLGLSLRMRVPASRLFACAFLLLPATYYFVNVQARFRHPLEPLLVIFSVFLFQSAKSGKQILSSRGLKVSNAAVH